MSDPVPREFFESAYDGTPPWEVGRPQPAFVELAEAGQVRGGVLDVGCGTGELALFLADRGHEVWGIDAVERAVDAARAKASERGLKAHFVLGDALDLGQLGRTFDTLTDCGLFHVFNDADRVRYVAGLRSVLAPAGMLHLLCFSEHETRPTGPRRVKYAELEAAFADGWRVQAIRPASFEVTVYPDGARAWLLTAERVGD